MIVIRFPDGDAKGRAIGFLAGRFSCISYASGETLVPPEALAELAIAGVRFSVEGPATYEQHIPAMHLMRASNGLKPNVEAG